MSSQQTNLSHKAKRAGVAANRKKEKEKLKNGQQSGKKPTNLKAFTFSSIVAAQRDRIRAAEVEHRRHHGHLERKDLVDNPPPKVIAVAGPQGSGKSTLIKCLVKHFTRAPSFDCTGPISVIADANTRLTFVEVPNDIGAMIDAAKTADMVLLTIDASFGFELETFEFLNILKTHGFPKVFGVLTHVDHFRTNAALSRIKKKMKKRFQQEVVDGAKFFHVSGLIHGRYPRREVLNIGRYISVTKPKPQTFRNDHPYVVVDRVEDMTHPGLIHNDPVCDRTVALYGYVRGSSMKPGQNVHLLGVGDFQIKDLQTLDDPLPLLKHIKNDSTEDREKRRTLKKQNIKIHAPFSDIGSVMYDKDAVYIKMRSHKVRTSNTEDLTMLGSANKTTEEDLLQQRQDVERRLNKINEHEAFIKSLQQKYNIQSTTPGAGASGNNKGGLDELLSNQTKISLFDHDDEITSKQFEELRKYRQGSTALPQDSIDIEDGLDDNTKRDPNALGAHDVDDDEDFLFGGGGNDNKQQQQKDDDFYSRISIKEVIGADGRVRKQVVFTNSLPGEDQHDDQQDDSDDDDDEGLADLKDIGDNEDGYYSDNDDDDDEEGAFDEDDEAALFGGGEGEFDYHDLFSQYQGEGQDDNDESDYDFDVSLSDEDAQYDAADFPDHQISDEDDGDNEYEDEDALDEDDLVQLGENGPINSKKSQQQQQPISAQQQRAYSIVNFIKGGPAGVYTSLNNLAGQSGIGSSNGNNNNNNGDDGNDFFFPRHNNNNNTGNNSSLLNRNNNNNNSAFAGIGGMSLMDLVYGAKETIFDTNNASLPFQDDNNNENKMSDEADDFFVMKHNIKQSVKSNRMDDNDDDINGGLSRFSAGKATATQSTFANNSASASSSTTVRSNLTPHNNVSFDMSITIDTTFVLSNEKMLSNWLDVEVRDTLRNRFVTGDWDAAKEKYALDEAENKKNSGLRKNEVADEIPEEFITDDESLTIQEKQKRRKLRLEWQRKKAFDIDDNDNESWGDDAFGKRKKKSNNKNGLDDKIFDHDEQLFGDFEEVNDDDDDEEGPTLDKDGNFDMKKHIEEKLRKKQKMFGIDLDSLEKEALSDEQQAERERVEAKLAKDNRGGKKLALNKQILRDHFDYFTAQHNFIMEKVEKNKQEMAKLTDDEKLILFGALPGTYVRILLTQVPCEFVEHLDPTYPIVMGGLLPTEQNMGFLQMRVKKHRWFHRLLKSNDPLIFSSGWRRFQTIPTYYVEDVTGRHRFLKYTPEHLHCLATTYAPLVTPNSGIIAFKNVYMAAKSLDLTNKTVSTFRVALTGVVLDINKKLEIRKKLKLIGTPLQIFNKTAYIQGMFNSTLEVAKFEGARIQTVSGIQGRIVKALTHEGKEGCFRATFNDKIVKSDIIICKTFANVKTYKYYNPVTSLLLANKSGWKGMRTTKEIRADKGEVIKTSKDSEYTDIIREKRKFAALKVPTALLKALPFKSKVKLDRNAEFGMKLKAQRAKLLKKRQLDTDTVDKIMATRKAQKTKYEDLRERFADKKTVKHAGFINQLQELSVYAKRNQDEKRKEKQKRAIGNTTENRERIERLKQQNKKRKFENLAKEKVRKNGGEGKKFKKGRQPKD